MSIANHPSLSSPSTSSFPPHPQSFYHHLISPPFSRLTPAKSQTLRLISICCQGQNTGPIKGSDGIGSEISSSASFPCSSPSSAINFLTLCHSLKTTKRKGWINHGIKGPESIADHMYRMSLMALIAGDVPGLNRERCIKIAIVHDIAEAIVGDITPSDGIPKAEKSRREQAALNEMCEVLGGGMRAEEIKELWAEYENNASLEANLVKDFDKNMGRFLTSFSYQQQGSFKLKLERVGQQRSYQEEAQPWLKDPINRQNFYIISSNLLIQTRKVVRCI